MKRKTVIFRTLTGWFYFQPLVDNIMLTKVTWECNDDC